MTQDLQNKLKSRWQTFTASEQRIAAYLLDNLGGIPFETAASMGQHAGVSAMTVGRFLRKLGYAGVAEMKQELRGDANWLKLYRAPGKGSKGNNRGRPAGDLDAEIRVLSEVHALTKDAQWQAIVHLLATADQVSVASFQLGRFLGETFAALLHHVRPRVCFASGGDGAYTDVLVDSTPNSCVVLIDERRYSRHFHILAREVAIRGIPLVIFTDNQCAWAKQLTPHVLMIPIHTDRPWHNFGAFGSLFSLLLSAVIEERGDAVYDRIEKITDMRHQFIGFSGPSRSGSHAAKRGQGAGSAAKPGRQRGKRQR